MLSRDTVWVHDVTLWVTGTLCSLGNDFLHYLPTPRSLQLTYSEKNKKLPGCGRCQRRHNRPSLASRSPLCPTVTIHDGNTSRVGGAVHLCLSTEKICNVLKYLREIHPSTTEGNNPHDHFYSTLLLFLNLLIVNIVFTAVIELKKHYFLGSLHVLSVNL